MATKAKSHRWLALESNPEVMNKYMRSLGLADESDGAHWSFEEIFSLDLLDMIPQPVAAVCLLFPITPAYEARALAEVAAQKEKGDGAVPEGVFFMRQSIGNACGTFSVVHAMANNLSRMNVAKDGVLSDFVLRAEAASPDDRNDLLAEDSGFKSAHDATAAEGQTETPDLDAQLNLHFVTFIEHKGELLEMDGRREFPIRHGPTTPATLLTDTAVLIRRFMADSPDSLNFVSFALSRVLP